MGFVKDHPLNLESGRVLTCPCKNVTTRNGNESEISSNTVKIIIIKEIFSVNNLQMSKSLPTFLSGISVSKRYFVSLCFLKGQRDSVKSRFVHI